MFGFPSILEVACPQMEPVITKHQDHDRGRQADDAARRALAVGLELAKNAVRAKTLEDLQFVLVNDTGALLPSDRCCLIVHFGGKSELVATNNQPRTEPKSDFVQRANRLAAHLKKVDRAVVLFPHSPKVEELSPETVVVLEEFTSYSGCSCLVIVPFSVHDTVVGHLVLEFFGERGPGEVELVTLLNMVPFLSSALADKWVFAKELPARRSFDRAVFGVGILGKRSSYARVAAVLAVTLLLSIALAMPVNLRVGGKAEVAPDHEYQAYVEVDGIVDRVLIREGERVKKGQVLAVLMEKEIDYKIREAKRLRESYKAEQEILRRQGAENPAKLAESQLVAIKSLRAQQELDFLEWQRQFLDVKAPVDGVVLTKKVESLVGKRFKAGEPFCKIAPSDVLVAEVFIRESDVPHVKPGQVGSIYFNYQPNQSYGIKVTAVPPMSETVERLGNVFRVRAELTDRPQAIRPGLEGVAHIVCGRTSFFFVLTRRLTTRFNELLLYF